MLTEHIDQANGFSLFVEKMIGTSLSPHRQSPTFRRDTLDMATQLDLLDKQRRRALRYSALSLG